MKHFTLLLLSALLVSGVNAQLLDSDFSDWENNLPVGWAGSKTNINLNNVLQVDNDGGQGEFAVELINQASGHRRFTTQPLTVEAGISYNITFWARGIGDIRTGIFDEREDGAGYAYSPYITLNTNDWEEHTQSLIAETNSDIAEFIFSLRNTADDLNIQIDRVIIETGEIETVSIFDIQYTEDPSGDSPYAGETVMTGGVVTASDDEGFFMQNGGGPWSGIYVFSTFNTPAVGDSVIFSGTVVEYFTMTQLSSVSGFTTISSDNELIITEISTAAGNTEPYEGVFVQVSAATVTDANTGFGQFEVNDGSGALLVGNMFYQHNATLGALYNIVGVSYYSFDEFKILPRSINDVTVVTAVESLDAAEVSVFPNPANDVLNLNWLNGNNGNVGYNVFNATGQLVSQGTLNLPMATVDVADLTPGLYTLNIETEKGVMYTRVMIAR